MAARFARSPRRYIPEEGSLEDGSAGNVWGEGASDLWGHLEEDDEGRELLEAVRMRLRGTDSQAREKPLPTDAETAAGTELVEIMPER